MHVSISCFPTFDWSSFAAICSSISLSLTHTDEHSLCRSCVTWVLPLSFQNAFYAETVKIGDSSHEFVFDNTHTFSYHTKFIGAQAAEFSPFPQASFQAKFPNNMSDSNEKRGIWLDEHGSFEDKWIACNRRPGGPSESSFVYDPIGAANDRFARLRQLRNHQSFNIHMFTAIWRRCNCISLLIKLTIPRRTHHRMSLKSCMFILVFPQITSNSNVLKLSIL